MSYQFLGSLDDLEQNFSTFPLYDRLCEKIKYFTSYNCTESQLLKTATDIKELTKEQSDLVFVLIRIHSLREGQKDVFSLPYGAKKSIGEDEYDIEYDIRSFPPKLQTLLVQFIKTTQGSCSPKRSGSPIGGLKSFMKKPSKVQDYTFILKKINPAQLDKEHNLKEVLICGKQYSFRSTNNVKFTKIDSIGIHTNENIQSASIIEGFNDGNQICGYCTLSIPSNNEPISFSNLSLKFCSYNCALAYSNINKNSLNKEECLKQHQQLFPNKICIPSPSFYLLNKFGGPLSPRSYQKEIQQKHFTSMPIFSLY